MFKASRQLFDSYEQLVAIQRQQLAVASKDRYDEQIDEIRELEHQKLEPKAYINEIRMDDQLYDEIATNNQSEILAYIQELQVMNTQLQHILNSWYSDASSEMQQVSVHRKTLQTYGGVNYSDVISYYFDDKK